MVVGIIGSTFVRITIGLYANELQNYGWNQQHTFVAHFLLLILTNILPKSPLVVEGSEIFILFRRDLEAYMFAQRWLCF